MAFPAPPPTCQGPGSGDPFGGGGGGKSHDAFPESRAASGFLLTCPQLPGPLTIYLSPSHRPSDGQPAKQSGTGITAARAGVREPRDFFLSPTSSSLSLSSSGFVRVLPGFTFIAQTLCLQSPTRSRHSASPGTAPRGPQGEGGGKRGRAGRWLEVAVALRAAWRRWGAGEVLQRHFAN